MSEVITERLLDYGLSGIVVAIFALYLGQKLDKLSEKIQELCLQVAKK